MRTAAALVAAGALLAAAAPPAAALPPVAQRYYVPLPEDQVLAALTAILPGRAACGLPPGDEVGEPVVTSLSIAPAADGTVILYDHWEDGYEADLARPVQPSTEVWGDGVAANGSPPGLPADLIGVGDIVVLSNAVRTATRAEVLDFDGGDRIAASLPVAVTRAAWATGTGARLAGALEVPETRGWGRRFVAPVGQDVAAGEMFEYTALAVMAARDGTTVAIDTDADGVADVHGTLAEGRSLLAPGVLAGAVVEASAPVQASLVTGDVCALHQSRWYTLLPVERWGADYSAPVGSSPGRPTSVFAFNPGPGAISLLWETGSGIGSGPDLAAGAVAELAMPEGSGARVFTADGSPFFALAAVDSRDSRFDWGYALIPGPLLTPQALLGWGAGRDPTSAVRPDENAGPAWVTPVPAPGAAGPVAVCVDFDGDARGAVADPFGGRCDRILSLDPFASARVYDPDGDQTGMVLYVCDGSGARLAVAWGQDPARASAGEPGLDLGTTVPPLPALAAAKEVELAVDPGGDGSAGPGDTLRYTITVRNTGRIPVGPVVVEDRLPDHTAYVAGSALLDVGAGAAALPDAGATPFPLDEGGALIGTLPVGAGFTIAFLVAIDDPLPPGLREILNTALVRSPGSEIPVEAALPLRLEARLEVRKAAEVLGDLVGTGTQGYWKNHPDAWPAAVTIGGVAYAPAEAIAIMLTPGAGDRTWDLFRQLAAAVLNAGAGAESSCVAATIADADAWIAAHPPGSGVRSDSPAWAAGAAALHERLDEYNNGRLCAPHRDDGGPGGGPAAVAFTVEVENAGAVPLAGVLLLDPAVPACGAEIGALAPGALARTTCTASGLVGPLVNVAIATGTAPDGATVEARAEVVVDAAGADPPAPEARTGTVRRWRRSPGDWPLTTLAAGDRRYAQGEARRAMRSRSSLRGRGPLLRQVLAARLNLLAGADPACVAGDLAAADAWLAEHPPGGDALGRGARREASAIARSLARFNRRGSCSPAPAP